VVTRDETNDEREVPAVAQAQELEDGPAGELPAMLAHRRIKASRQAGYPR